MGEGGRERRMGARGLEDGGGGGGRGTRIVIFCASWLSHLNPGKRTADVSLYINGT